MTRNVILNNDDHLDLTVRFAFGADFGDAVNLAPVFPTEFVEAARDYPLFLDRDGSGAWRTVALLGFDRDENLFLDGDRWAARYIPAAHRRGPFRIGFQGGTDGPAPVILLDLDDARVAPAGDPAGVRLFRDHGGHTPALDGVAAALRLLHDGVETAAALYAAWERCGLIESVRLEVKLDGGTTYTIADLHTVSTTRLAGLDGEALATLNRANFLAPAFLLAAAAGNVQHLIERRARRDRPTA